MDSPVQSKILEQLADGKSHRLSALSGPDPLTQKSYQKASLKLEEAGYIKRRKDGTGLIVRLANAVAAFNETGGETVQMDGSFVARWGGWTPNQGPIVDCFAGKPEGHRCLWSVRWLGSGVPQHPIIETMSPEMLVAECRDYVARHVNQKSPNQELFDTWVERVEPRIRNSPSSWDTYAFQCIRLGRGTPGEYVSVWDPPIGRQQYAPVFRPGWKPNEDWTEEQFYKGPPSPDEVKRSKQRAGGTMGILSDKELSQYGLQNQSEIESGAVLA